MPCQGIGFVSSSVHAFVWMMMMIIVFDYNAFNCLSIATVTSCIFAEVITIDKGISFLSVRICLLLPNLLLSVGLWPVFFLLKVIL